MKPLQQDIENQIAEIEKMWFKNIRMAADYKAAPADNKPLTPEQFESLVFRTKMLEAVIKDVKEINNDKK